jgi:DNA polymerase-3 subunit gamma/tau
MATEVLYRKWRPRAFGEVAGQDAIVRTLTNGVAGSKVAHAYLFSGPRGTGKTTMGRLLAKAVNCTSPKDGEPCNDCESCRAYLEGRALDLIELDAASNRGIDEIRGLREKANFAPAAGQYKVYLVDEVHMLTDPAFNALLKTLEEPPPHVIFVLATTEDHKVPATIVSRCQRFDFRRIPLSAAVDRLEHIANEEGFSCSREALELIARTATGSMRDAINLLDQLVDTHGRELTLDDVREGLGLVIDARSLTLAGHAVRAELADGLAVIASVRDDGLDLRQFQRQLVQQLRGLLLVKSGAPDPDAWSADQLDEMRALVSDVPPARIVRALRAFGEADLRADPLSPLPLELALADTVLEPAPVAQVAAPVERPAARPPSGRPSPAPAPRPKAEASKTPPAAETVPEALAAKPKPPQVESGAEPATPVAEQEAVMTKTVASNGAGSADLEAARERWSDVYQRARELNYKTGALLNSGCGIIESSPAELVFGFRHKMLLDRMLGDGGEHLQALQQAVDDVLGPGRQVRCVLDANVDIQRPKASGGHLVRAVEELGGQVVPDGE